MLTQLECLYLNSTKITDAGLAGLHSLVHLRELHLEQTHVTPEAVAALARLFPAALYGSRQQVSDRRCRAARSGVQ